MQVINSRFIEDTPSMLGFAKVYRALRGDFHNLYTVDDTPALCTTTAHISVQPIPFETPFRPAAIPRLV